jgi:hypothetical protein
VSPRRRRSDQLRVPAPRWSSPAFSYGCVLLICVAPEAAQCREMFPRASYDATTTVRSGWPCRGSGNAFERAARDRRSAREGKAVACRPSCRGCRRSSPVCVRPAHRRRVEEHLVLVDQGGPGQTVLFCPGEQTCNVHLGLVPKRRSARPGAVARPG